MWIERELTKEVVAAASAFPVVALVGPRQVGKTSLLERAFPSHRFVSLDVGAQAEMAETRPSEFLARFPPPAVIDEVQYAPGLLRHLKAEVDRQRSNGLFVLTGSQGFPLMQGLSESLAGRVAVIPMLGLSASELAASGRLPGATGWPALLWRGSFPALWAEAEGGPGRDRWYQGYLASYLERDVRNLLRVSSLRDFERFLRACAARTAQSLNLADMARDVGVAPSTAREWLGVLHASNLVHLLEPYHRSLGKRLAKSPKLHFTDTGLASFLMGFDSAEAAWHAPQSGALWESHVVGQWLRWRDWHAPAASLWYWREASGSEVDLLVEHNGALTAIECKRSERPGTDDARSLHRLRAFYGPELVRAGFVACPTAEPYDLAPGVTARPGWRAWELAPPDGRPLS